MAFIVGFAQMVFLFNLDLEHHQGNARRRNPWRRDLAGMADAPTTRPAHGNCGKELPIVYRWAYDYSVPGAQEDFIPQNVPKRHRKPWHERHPRSAFWR